MSSCDSSETPVKKELTQPKPFPTLVIETTPTVYYKKCSEAPGPIKRGEPGYRTELDKNNNGTACE